MKRIVMEPEPPAGETAAAAWLGQPISASNVARIMGINLVSSIILQIEPMLLSGLADSGILSLSQVGRVATIELATMALVMTWSVARLPYRNVRKYCMLAAFAALAANFVTAWLTSAAAIYGARALSGGASGIFLWAIIGVITRSGSPARLNGINISVQCTASLVAATFFSTYVIPHFGAGAGFCHIGRPWRAGVPDDAVAAEDIRPAELVGQAGEGIWHVRLDCPFVRFSEYGRGAVDLGLYSGFGGPVGTS